MRIGFIGGGGHHCLRQAVRHGDAITGKGNTSMDNARTNRQQKRAAARILLASAALAAVCGCAAPGTARIRARHYSVRVEGAPDTELARDLLSLADTAQRQPATRPDSGRLRMLAEHDLPQMKQLLSAHGYFAADIEPRIAEARRPVLTYVVHPGSMYALERAVVPSTLPQHDLSGVAEDRSAAPVRLVREADRMEAVWRNHGFPHARVELDHLVVDHDTHSAEAHFTTQPGAYARFGPVSFEGRNRLRQGWLRDAIPWREGHEWQRSLVDEYRSRLLVSGLFSTVDVHPADEPGEDDRLPMTVTLRERRPRTISAAAGYRTDEGFGGMVNWQHRNLTGGAEQLDLRGEWAEKYQSGSLRFRRPRFIRADQALRLEAEARAEQPEAFDTRGFRAAVIVERVLGSEWTGEAGVGGRDVRIEQADRRDEFTLLSLPAAVFWDGRGRDAQHNPSRGGRASARITPFHDLAGTGLWFLKSEVVSIRYARLSRRPDLRLAARVGLGALTGSGPFRIPADERFYAGGGGSVRGYAYQSIAPRDAAGLSGGRSLIESSVEIRWAMAPPVGFVAFFDGGTVMRSAWPDGSERMLWGTGVGFRYDTVVGPVRLDLAAPLNRRPEIDDAWQLYISIGQAF